MRLSTIYNRPSFNQVFVNAGEKSFSYEKGYGISLLDRDGFGASKLDFPRIIQKLKNPKDYFYSEYEIERFIHEISDIDFESASEEEAFELVTLFASRTIYRWRMERNKQNLSN